MNEATGQSSASGENKFDGRFQEFVPQSVQYEQYTGTNRSSMPLEVARPPSLIETPPMIQQREQLVFKVQFKTCVRYHFCSAFFCAVMPKEGDLVMIAAERGVDLGMIVTGIPLDQFFRKMHFGNTSEVAKVENGKIIRFATLRETQQIALKGRDEEEVVMVISYFKFLTLN